MIKKTGDGSSTFYVPELKEHYHSIYGAIRESEHVFILNGLLALKRKRINILEVGFGTGLNILLSCLNARKSYSPVCYTALEPYPLTQREAGLLNFGEILKIPGAGDLLNKIHQAPWEQPRLLSRTFSLEKYAEKIETFEFSKQYHLVYFDAFAPAVQPEIWDLVVFQKIAGQMQKSGILVTYCAKGQVRRNLEKSGLKVERLPGPPGKREMLRAAK